MLRTAMSRFVQKVPCLQKKIYGRGWLIKVPLGQLWVNWVFRVLFARNRSCQHSVHYTSTVNLPQFLEVEEGDSGPFVSLAVSGGCYLQCGNGLKIGAGTIWAPNVSFVSANHDMRRKDKGWIPSPPIKIGRSCWIGAGAVILPGVVLGDESVVAANAVVSKSYPEGRVVLAGVPARPIKQLQ